MTLLSLLNITELASAITGATYVRTQALDDPRLTDAAAATAATNDCPGGKF